MDGGLEGALGHLGGGAEMDSWAEKQGSQTSPRCPTGLLSKRGPVTSPIRVSESEPAKQGWKSDDESGSSPLPGSAVL